MPAENPQTMSGIIRSGIHLSIGNKKEKEISNVTLPVEGSQYTNEEILTKVMSNCE